MIQNDFGYPGVWLKCKHLLLDNEQKKHSTSNWKNSLQEENFVTLQTSETNIKLRLMK